MKFVSVDDIPEEIKRIPTDEILGSIPKGKALFYEGVNKKMRARLRHALDYWQKKGRFTEFTIRTFSTEKGYNVYVFRKKETEKKEVEGKYESKRALE